MAQNVTLNKVYVAATELVPLMTQNTNRFGEATVQILSLSDFAQL